MKEQLQGKMLCMHFTEADQWQGISLYRAIVAKCRDLGMAGATVFRGLEGFGASARIHHAHNLSISPNAPVTVSIIDSDDQIQKLLPHLREMNPGGLISVSPVEMIHYSRSKRGEPIGN